MSSVGQLVGGLVGGVVGFFVGGPSGAYYGAQAGIMIGGAIDPPDGPVINGPRLDDLSVQTSTYGAFIPRNYGTIAQTGNVFWLKGDALTETARVEESGGKGGPTTTTNLWDYSATFALGLCEGPIDGIRRIWINGQLFYDAGSDDMSTIIASNESFKSFTLYYGNDTQDPDPTIQADKGTGNVPAYRGLAYIVFDNLPLAKYNNSLAGAQIKVEIVKNATLTNHLIDVGNVPYNATDWHSTMGGSAKINIEDSENTYVVCSPSSPWTFIELKQFGDTVDATTTQYSGGGFQISTDLHDADWALRGFALNSYVLWSYKRRVYRVDSGYVSTGVRFADSNGNAFILVDAGLVANLIHAPLYDPIPPLDVTGILLQQHTRLSITDENAELVGWNGNAVRFWRAGGTLSVINFEVYGVIDDAPIALIDSYTVTMPSGAYEITGSTATSSTSGDILTVFVGSVSKIVIIDLASKSLISINSVDVTLDATGGGSISRIGDVVTLTRKRVTTGGDTFESNTWQLDRITSSPALLADVVEAECLTSNLLTAGDIDVTELTDSVRGYRIAALGALRGGIEPLRVAWPFDVIQHGYDIKFKRRGSASVATINADELDARAAGESPGVQITNIREMDTLLPSNLRLNYIDSVREYDTNQQISDRGL